MIRFFTLRLWLVLCVLVPVLFSSCKDFSGSKTVPSYIRIDSIGLSCDYYTYGANTSNFTDAFVIVGGFEAYVELPAVVPILEEGPQRVIIMPGIQLNGIKSSRVSYPFVQQIVYPSLNLIPDSIVTIHPMASYYSPSDNFHVRWIEDFEGGAVTLQRTAASDTTLMRASGPEAWHDPEGIYSSRSGKVVLTSDTMQFELETTVAFEDLPNSGEHNSSCILEMDYKTTDTIEVGLNFYQTGVKTIWPLVRVRPNCEPGSDPDRWNKIYVNIGPSLLDNKDADNVTLTISSWPTRNEGTQYFYFDNLKIIYREQ